ncbi:MAG: hypothetical protein RBR87_12485 [Bacteroidales bacterium]|nr:hypothetical protein [Bacteroidales bacterium]
MRMKAIKKSLLFAIVLPLLLYSCKPEIKTENKEDTTETTISLNDFAETFGGVWIPEAYLNAIIKHKSAYLSHLDIPYISELKIHKNNLKNDTLNVLSGINNHEGFDFKVWETKQSDKPEYANLMLEWEEEHEFIFSYSTADTTISIIVKNKNDSLVKRTDYIRILNQEYPYNDNESAYDYLSRKIILNGKYQILDATKKDLGIADFEANTGIINGFKYAYYTLATDFIGGPVYPSDYIILRPAIDMYSDQQFLSMITQNDTIYLYENIDIETDTSYNVTLGKLCFYLIDKN